jgi:Fe-S-cluster-containing dehydrogenase component
MASAPAQASTDHPPVSEEWMGVLVDITKCVGCRRCEYACQEAAGFGVPPIETYEDKSVMREKRRPLPSSYTVMNEYENPADPAKPVYVKANCLHCNDPACMSACLVGAFSKQHNGPVVYEAWKCMGCRYCMVACPFQIPTYDYDVPLTPEVRKCNLCAHRVPSLQEVPACVKICPEEVMTYGKRTDLIELAHETIRREPSKYIDHVYGEHEAGGTSWLYLSSQPFEELDFVKLDDTAPPRLTETIQHGVFKHFVPPLALYGLLGVIMYVAKPKEGAGHRPDDQHH